MTCLLGCSFQRCLLSLSAFDTDFPAKIVYAFLISSMRSNGNVLFFVTAKALHTELVHHKAVLPRHRKFLQNTVWEALGSSVRRLNNFVALTSAKEQRYLRVQLSGNQVLKVMQWERSVAVSWRSFIFLSGQFSGGPPIVTRPQTVGLLILTKACVPSVRRFEGNVDQRQTFWNSFESLFWHFRRRYRGNLFKENNCG